MRFESLNADLRRWLKTSIEAGHDAEALQQALRATGYESAFARQAVLAALAQLRPKAKAVAPVPAAQPAVQSPRSLTEALKGSGNAIATSDRTVKIQMRFASPQVLLFGDLLSGEECAQMIELSSRKLQRSSVVNPETGEYDVHPDRTSSGTHFARGENELIARIERRIAELTGYPQENGEPIQVLHYTPGAEYRPHHDYFDPAQPGNDRVLAMGGQRVATLIMYLNDVEAGGSTVFPTLGLDVLPRRGAAVYFANTLDSGATDVRTLHGGSPVVAGEKWIATKWIRQGRYGGPGG